MPGRILRTAATTHRGKRDRVQIAPLPATSTKIVRKLAPFLKGTNAVETRRGRQKLQRLIRIRGLTPEQKQVLSGRLRGLTLEEIAQDMGCKKSWVGLLEDRGIKAIQKVQRKRIN
ncbi:MAG: sigma factor-like helix-turn-helix DNA-binding protein [archaeon]|jgi:DNA-directed RNA polymerase specialized sigma24 family protein|nr:sigma factor-like helix-turn-helix DNA-binding protein [archaeon]